VYWTNYYANGNIWEKGNYKNGKKECYWKTYNWDGTFGDEMLDYPCGNFKNDIKISD
jgi:antitoxin component YwqK of YwqJK toxin-antitoxin module